MHFEGLAPGTRIAGTYLVERTIGRGGMGAVYVVSHLNTGKRMAMKCLLPEFVQNADLVGRFLREAQVMGRLHHRHVVDVFDVGRDGDVLYIVMELLEGKPFSDVLHDSSLTLEETLAILLRAMEGVAAAHDRGVIHRDLKPDNIFVCVGASGRLDDPRVLDFGISKLEDPAADPLTRTGIALGTPYYMSIEQLKGQRDLDARVDVYALGVILYEAIAGSPPFEADSVSALAIKVLTTEPLALGGLRPDLPDGLADVVMKAIARDRQDRYRSVRALIEALRPYVPKSAGLLVPEGEGRPLRTPRGSAREGFAVERRGEEVVAPAVRDGGFHPMLQTVSTPDLFAPPRETPSGLQTAAGRGHTTPLPIAAVPSRRSPWPLRAVLATGLLGAAATAFVYDKATPQPPSALPAAVPAAPSAPLQAPHVQGGEGARAAEAVRPQSGPAPSLDVDEDESSADVGAAGAILHAPDAAPARPDPSARPASKARAAARAHRSRELAQARAVQSEPQSKPAVQAESATKPGEAKPDAGKRAAGRAGSMGSDEF